MGMKYDPVPLVAQPGFLLTQSPLAAKGRFTGGFGVRFRNNFPEKRAGFSALSTTALNGIPRGSFAWNDLTGRELIGAGTSTNLYVIPDTNYVPMDITPAGLPAGSVYATQLSGYGTGFMGLADMASRRRASSSPARRASGRSDISAGSACFAQARQAVSMRGTRHRSAAPSPRLFPTAR